MGILLFLALHFLVSVSHGLVCSRLRVYTLFVYVFWSTFAFRLFIRYSVASEGLHQFRERKIRLTKRRCVLFRASEIQSSRFLATNAPAGASKGAASPAPRPACETNGSIVSAVCKYRRSWEVRIARTGWVLRGLRIKCM